MSEDGNNENKGITGEEISAAVTGLGWRYINGIVHLIQTDVRVRSLAHAAEVAQPVITAAGPDAGSRLQVDLRADRIVITVAAPSGVHVTQAELDLIEPITNGVRALGLSTDAHVDAHRQRSTQLLEIAIDAMDIRAVRPFWKAVLGYIEKPGEDTEEGPLVDPVGQSPTVWFQPMDAPRPQRNRMHLDVSVPHDDAESRIKQALAAGGRVASDSHAPAFWVLADAEGNEACVTTWRQPRS